MFIILNGPLGIGKSTLAEALSESIDQCVMLDGDHLIAANPPSVDPFQHLHSTIALLVAHHQRFGYRHFVIDHVWHTSEELADLRRILLDIDGDADIHCFLLTLPLEENLHRIARRQSARALEEQEFERRTVAEEREALFNNCGDDLGERFDVSATPDELVATMRRRLGLR
jgi:shikimate kinase